MSKDMFTTKPVPTANPKTTDPWAANAIAAETVLGPHGVAYGTPLPAIVISVDPNTVIDPIDYDRDNLNVGGDSRKRWRKVYFLVHKGDVKERGGFHGCIPFSPSFEASYQKDVAGTPGNYNNSQPPRKSKFFGDSPQSQAYQEQLWVTCADHLFYPESTARLGQRAPMAKDRIMIVYENAHGNDRPRFLSYESRGQGNPSYEVTENPFGRRNAEKFTYQSTQECLVAGNLPVTADQAMGEGSAITRVKLQTPQQAPGFSNVDLVNYRDERLATKHGYYSQGGIGYHSRWPMGTTWSPLAGNYLPITKKNILSDGFRDLTYDPIGVSESATSAGKAYTTVGVFGYFRRKSLLNTGTKGATRYAAGELILDLFAQAGYPVGIALAALVNALKESDLDPMAGGDRGAKYGQLGHDAASIGLFQLYSGPTGLGAGVGMSKEERQDPTSNIKRIIEELDADGCLVVKKFNEGATVAELAEQFGKDIERPESRGVGRAEFAIQVFGVLAQMEARILAYASLADQEAWAEADSENPLLKWADGSKYNSWDLMQLSTDMGRMAMAARQSNGRKKLGGEWDELGERQKKEFAKASNKWFLKDKWQNPSESDETLREKDIKRFEDLEERSQQATRSE